MRCTASARVEWTGIARLATLAAVLLLTSPAVAQLTADYRVTELTQACYHRTRVPASVDRAKRGVGEFKFGCAPAEEGREVRLIKRKGDESLVHYCITDRCDRRWILSSKLTRIDR
jgi:hypothetical protein